MNQGVRTIVYPVKDMARAKTRFRTLLGVAPYADSPYYVGFRQIYISPARSVGSFK